MSGAATATAAVAGTMASTPWWVAPLTTAAFSSVAGALLAPKQQDAPMPWTPTPAPAQAQAADSAIFTGANSASASIGGPSSTLLTGLSGVQNSSLNLGRNTTLGGTT